MEKSNMIRPPPRPIHRLLIANRGEIATRIISTATELSIQAIALYIPSDSSHILNATHAIKLPSASIFSNINELIKIAKQNDIDAVHPGYGFLSENAGFAKRMWEEAGVVVVGPGWGILEETGDKLRARELAERCNVPVPPTLLKPTSRSSDILAFANTVGYPIMVKAVDGGGGRGIRLITSASELPDAVKRAVEESPSRTVFAEKAMVDGHRHVEVQIIGDGTGTVTHLWERECSIQRRYQKVVEIAPSVVEDRDLIARVIDDALKMAKSLNYFSLGTFEFLLHPLHQTHTFLEINPRLQVEHTITETLTSTDLIRTQLLLSQGHLLSSSLPPHLLSSPPQIPPPSTTHSIQLRITAENPKAGFSLSIGKITAARFPAGNGVRVDTHLRAGYPAVVSVEFDSLLAKIIVSASSWDAVVRKAARALQETSVVGVKTNLDLLRGIIAHEDFAKQKCDTQWLERRQEEILALGERIGTESAHHLHLDAGTSTTAGILPASTNTLFKKGDAWNISLEQQTPLQTPTQTAQNQTHHLQITSIHRNEFPTSLTASILYTTPFTTSSTPYILTLSSTTSSAGASSSAHPRASPNNPTHISIPFSGKLVELLVEEGDEIKKGDVVAVVQQMKMELEVRSHRVGRVSWVSEVEEGEELEEGMLIAIVEGAESKL